MFQLSKVCDEYHRKWVTYKLTQGGLFKHVLRGFAMKLNMSWLKSAFTPQGGNTHSYLKYFWLHSVDVLSHSVTNCLLLCTYLVQLLSSKLYSRSHRQIKYNGYFKGYLLLAVTAMIITRKELSVDKTYPGVKCNQVTLSRYTLYTQLCVNHHNRSYL